MTTEKYTPLYEKIKDYILDKINNNEWLPGHRLPTELELAEYFNVSRITTKRAMEELARQGIIERIKGQGSFVSRPSECLNNGSNQIISMILPYDNNRTELIDYISGATDVLSERKYYLTVQCTKGESLKMEREFLLKLPKDGVSGIIYYPLNINSEIDILEPMYMDNYPIVTIDKYFNNLMICSVVSENYKGTYTIMTKLIDAGHRKIAFITRNLIENASSLKERYSAYCKALKDNNITFDIDLVVTNYSMNTFKKKGDAEKTEYLAKIIKGLLDLKVTAIFIEHDTLIINAFETLMNQGVTIPRNFCITGFDAALVPKQLNLSYIFVQQNFYEIGKRAAELILNMIENKQEKQTKIEIPVSYIEEMILKS